MIHKRLLLSVCAGSIALGFSLSGLADVAGCAPATSKTQQDALLSSAPYFQNPPVYDFTSGEAIIADMTVQFREATLAGCPTKLRNYGGAKYDGRPVGPTMLINPGQQYIGLIHNLLPLPPDGLRIQSHGGESTETGYVAPDGAHKMKHNVDTTPENEINPGKFNITNLHTHGWHVSPTQNHDNIFAEIHPGDKPYLQQVVLPDDHVAGTFWYHAHVHGSTTIQVASGMAGALIVKDDKVGLDPVLDGVTDNIFVFQQLAYDENGEVKNYDNLQQGPYSKLNRPVFVNGQAYPIITVKKDEVQRWRFIHAGITDGIKPMIVADYTKDDSPAFTEMHEIALDGIPTGDVLPIDYADLAPGYRVDVLVQLTGTLPDKLYLVDHGQCFMQKTKFKNTCQDPNNGNINMRRVLAQINIVEESSDVTALPAAKSTASKPGMDSVLKPYITGGYDHSKTDPFELVGPLDPITEQELTGKTQIVHFMASGNYQCPVQGGSCQPCGIDDTGSLTACPSKKTSYMVCDGKVPMHYTDKSGATQSTDVWSCFNFNPSTDYARTLALDTASRWYVSGDTGQNNHTFHIHVNPFQVQRKWVNPGYPASVADQWVWKDTLRTPATGEDQAELKSRYTDFTGAFVQHCHVLNHEDQGMMQVVEVVPAMNDLKDNPADSEQAGNHMH